MIGGVSLENHTENNSAFLYSVTRTENSCPVGDFWIDSDNSDIEAFTDLRYGGDIFGVVFLVFAIILMFFHVFFSCFMKSTAESIIISCFLLIFIFVETIICPISLKYLNQITKNDKFLTSIVSASCFGVAGYNAMFANYGEDLLVDSKKIYGFIDTILYFSLVVFILDILYLIDKIVYNYFFDKEKNGPLEEGPCCEGGSGSSDKFEKYRIDDCCDNNIDCECDCL